MQDVRLHTSASVLGFQGILRQTLEQAAWELICQWQPETAYGQLEMQNKNANLILGYPLKEDVDYIYI